jgi:hypothetical protein
MTFVIHEALFIVLSKSIVETSNFIGTIKTEG